MTAKTKNSVRRMLAYTTRDEVLVDIAHLLLKMPCASDWDANRRYDQVVALDAARQALKRPRKKGSRP